MSAAKNGGGAAHKIASIPIVGYVVRLVWLGATLPKRQTETRNHLSSLNKQLVGQTKQIKQALGSLDTLSATLQEETMKNSDYQKVIMDQVSDIRHRLLLLAKEDPSVGKGKSKATVQAPSELFGDDHSMDSFYKEFENRFRGSEDAIKERLQVYVPYFKKLPAKLKKLPVLDIGCGRGELLEVLQGAGITARGIDLNKSMVDRVKERGYKAEQAEALSYLMKQKTGSFAAITGFHIAEHIPFNLMLRIFEECYRVLQPGGFIIFEKPNPESLHVGSFSFYYDPSHLHPLPPELLAFATESRGFKEVNILRLHPKEKNYKTAKKGQDKLVSEMVERFYGPQDYAVISYK
jgi:O-antigen chain-terminating methyltransferase